MDLIESHKTYIAEFGYNSTEGGNNLIRYSETSKELKKARSDRMKDRVVSNETKEKMSRAKSGQIPWNKGRKMDDGYKERISEFHGRKKAVLLNGEEFRSLTECARYVGVTRDTVRSWICGKRKIPEKYGIFELRYK